MTASHHANALPFDDGDREPCRLQLLGLATELGMVAALLLDVLERFQEALARRVDGLPPAA